jgi:hypothetical protein
MSEPNVDPFNASLVRMGHAIRRGHAAFAEADAAFEEAMQALIVMTETRGTVTGQLSDLRQDVADLRDTVSTLQGMVLAQSQTIADLRGRLNGGTS